MGELGRRLVHASGAIVPGLYLVGLLDWDGVRLLLLLGLFVALVLETVRLRVGLDWWVYEHLTRPYEAENVAGYGLYMVSVTGVAVAFRPEVAIPAMLMLMIGDPVSGALGSGELRRVKRPVAIVGMFVVSFVLALPFAIGRLEATWGGILAATVGAGAGTIADAVKPSIGPYVIDDNLTIPVGAAVGLWTAYQVVPVLL